MRAVLGAEPATELVGEATDGEEAVELALEVRPDVILMDLDVPNANGLEATRRVLEASPDTAVLVLTMFEEAESVFAAVRAGARGYLLKGSDGAQTLRAIRAVANGEAIFGPEIARLLRGHFAALYGAAPETPSVQASEDAAYRASEKSHSRTPGE